MPATGFDEVETGFQFGVALAFAPRHRASVYLLPSFSASDEGWSLAIRLGLVLLTSLLGP